MKTRIQISSYSQIEINFGNMLLMLLAVHYIIKITFSALLLGVFPQLLTLKVFYCNKIISTFSLDCS